MKIGKVHYLFTKRCIISTMKLLPEYTNKYQPGMVNRRNKNKPSPTGKLKNKVGNLEIEFGGLEIEPRSLLIKFEILEV